MQTREEGVENLAERGRPLCMVPSGGGGAHDGAWRLPVFDLVAITTSGELRNRKVGRRPSLAGAVVASSNATATGMTRPE